MPLADVALEVLAEDVAKPDPAGPIQLELEQHPFVGVGSEKAHDAPR